MKRIVILPEVLVEELNHTNHYRPSHCTTDHLQVQFISLVQWYMSPYKGNTWPLQSLVDWLYIWFGVWVMNMFNDCYRPRSEGDNVLGSVRPSVCPSGCTQGTLYTTTTVYGVLVQSFCHIPLLWICISSSDWMASASHISIGIYKMGIISYLGLWQWNFLINLNSLL